MDIKEGKKSASGKPKLTITILEKFISNNEEKYKYLKSIIIGSDRIPKSHLSMTDAFSLEMIHEEVDSTDKKLCIARKYLQYLREKKELKKNGKHNG